MSNQPNEAAQRYSPCREKSETLVGGVVTTMKPNDQGNWVRYSLLRKAEAEISSLRSALANAEKQIEEHERWRTQHGAAYQQVADARDAALAKLAEAENDRKHVFDLCAAAEKARDHNRECIRRLVEERDAAIRQRDHAEVMKYPVENERICELEAERDALAAQLAEARGLLGDLLAWLTSPKMQTWQYHENGFFAEDAQKFVNRLSLAPPSDRGAEGDRS